MERPIAASEAGSRLADSPKLASLPKTSRASSVWLIVGGIVLLTVAVRLPGINRPLLGNFATKNVIYAMIARNFAQGNASIWYPTVDCLRAGRPALHLTEFPVSAYVTGGLWRLFGGSLDVWGRGTSIAFSGLAVLCLYWLVRGWHGVRVAAAAAIVLAIAPVSVIYGQSFMLEASVVCFGVMAMVGMARWSDGKGAAWLAVAAVGLALVTLSKIYMLSLIAPMGWIAWSRLRESTTRTRLIIAFTTIAAVTPSIAWHANVLRVTAPGHPLSRHVFYSIRQSAEDHSFPSPLLTSPEFYRQVLDDLPGVALTPIGMGLALIGMWHPGWRRHLLWLLSLIVLVPLMPRKFYEMNYYYLVILPPLCVLAGLGWEVLTRSTTNATEGSRKLAWAPALAIVAGLVFATRFAAIPAFHTPHKDRAVVAAGEALQRVTRADEPVVAIHGSSPDLLYYCDRRGWSISPEAKDMGTRLNECREAGARYVVVVDARGESRFDFLPLVVDGAGFQIVGLDASRSDLAARLDRSTR